MRYEVLSASKYHFILCRADVFVWHITKLSVFSRAYISSLFFILAMVERVPSSYLITVPITVELDEQCVHTKLFPWPLLRFEIVVQHYVTF